MSETTTNNTSSWGDILAGLGGKYLDYKAQEEAAKNRAPSTQGQVPSPNPVYPNVTPMFPQTQGATAASVDRQVSGPMLSPQTILIVVVGLVALVLLPKLVKG